MSELHTIARPFTVASLASHWGTSDTFIYDQIKAGRLKAMRFGGKLIRIKPEWVEEYECQATHHTDSGSSPEHERMDPHIGTIASSGLTNEDRTVSRLGRLIDRPQKPRLVTSGSGKH